MAENDRGAEAAEKLQRGIEESRQRIQRQAMELAQEFFGDSVEGLKGKVQESRATLEGLPDQIPGGQEEPFRMLLQELMENYAAIERALDEARENVANLDTEEMRRQEGSEASREIVVDASGALVEVDGGADNDGADSDGAGEPEAAGETAGETGQGAGEIVVDASGALVEADGGAGEIVVDAGGTIIEADGGADSDGAGEPLVTGAARRRAERLGVDLTTVKGTGVGGLITLRDVPVA